MSELKNWLHNLPLNETKSTMRFAQRPDFYEGLEVTTADQAAINFKSIQSFAAGLPVDRQEDVLNCLLLAQRAATKAYPEDKDLMMWHQKYFEVLQRLGWLFDNKGFQTFNSMSNSFEMDKVLLEILAQALTGNQVAIIRKAIDALKALGSDDKRFQAFERNTHSLTRGNFQLGIATMENETLSISSTAFILNTRKVCTKILFFRAEKDDVELQYSQLQATLNYAIYNDVRNDVRQKLGDTTAYVADLEI